MAANIRPAVRFEQPGHGSRLLGAVLEEQYALVGEDGAALCCQCPYGIEAVFPCGQCRLRLVLQFAQCLVITAHLRRV